ncbi:MAG: phosphoribosylglycinamide synthetase C domain-containing protein [Patescibacteria group bacterium]
MKILFISNDLIGGNLAYLMKKEGHEVKLYIDSKQQRGNFDNLLNKTTDWRRELTWVGKRGLIVFDDIGYGKIQDELRTKGYSVFGGSRLGDKLESDREHAQDIFSQHNIKTVPIKNFKNIPDAINFIKKNRGAWVIKQNGHASKSLNYVPEFDDSRDTLNVLENYNRHTEYRTRAITLQQKINGVEIGCARYFNGKDWVGPIEMNVEYKRFFPGDLGPPTSEMGTLAWYDDDDEGNLLFQKTLFKLKPYLQKIDYRGDIDLNCIVNKTGAYPLEATPRFGSPIVHLHSEIHKSPWGQFLKAVARGEPYKLKWHRGYGIVILVTVPPFPYSKKLPRNSSYGINAYFDDMKKADWHHVHFEEISLRSRENQYYISDHRGYILYLTGMGETVEQAQHHVYDLAKKVKIPKMFYRNDIGNRFVIDSQAKLRKWGYI